MKQVNASAATRHAALSGELDRLSCLAMAAARDFNDELTLILNHADISMDLIGDYHPAEAPLEDLQRCVRRCAEITRCLSIMTLRTRQRLATLQ
ncbi:MAG: hypothetical protein U0Q18_26915 [Bryobacteraceae bacterium]